MRKLFLYLSVLLLYGATAHAFDWEKREWRSSTTASNDPQVAIASYGAVAVWKVIVEEAGTSSVFDFGDGHISTNSARNVKRINTTSTKEFEYKLTFSSGLVYGTNGSAPARVTILWDWMYRIPTGLERLGR